MAYAEAITALADPTRRRILRRCACSPVCGGAGQGPARQQTYHGKGGHTRCDLDLDIHFHIFHGLERHRVDAGDRGGAA